MKDPSDVEADVNVDEKEDFSHFYEDKSRGIIQEANSVSLTKIFRHYNIRVDEGNRKAPCPFHKGGRESSASFYYYPESNTYFCFGCKIGSRPIDFVSLIENCTYMEAANKILSQFSSGDYVIDNSIDKNNCSERLETMLD